MKWPRPSNQATLRRPPRIAANSLLFPPRQAVKRPPCGPVALCGPVDFEGERRGAVGWSLKRKKEVGSPCRVLLALARRAEFGELRLMIDGLAGQGQRGFATPPFEKGCRRVL